MIHLVHSEALLDVRREVTHAAAERAAAAVVLVVPVQVPLVRRAEVAQRALDHRHRVVLHVLREARLEVRHIVTFFAREEL